MKNFKRIIAGATAVVSVLGLAACGGGGGSTATTTTPAVTYDNPLDEEAQAAIGEVAEGNDLLTGELENKTVKWLSNWDINPDSSGKKTPVELELFQQKYGGVIEYYPTSWEARFSDLSTYVMSDEGIDFYPFELAAFPKGAINGMFQPFDEYVEWDSPLWSEVKNVCDMFTWGDGHYVLATGVTSNGVMVYNKQTIEENGLEDPAALFEAGKWDWNALKDMLSEFCDPDNGKNGIDGWWFEAACMKTTGVPAVGIEGGKLVSNLRNADLERVMDYQLSLYNDGYKLDQALYDWTVQPQRVGEGSTLFYPCDGTWILLGDYNIWGANFGDPADVMFVPMPKDPEADVYYMPASCDGFFMVKGSKNPQGVIKFVECKLVAAKDEKAIAVADQEMRETNGWTDDMIEMDRKIKEMTMEHPVFDYYTGASEDISSILDSGETGIRAAFRGKAWSTTREEVADAISEWLNDINVKAGVA